MSTHDIHKILFDQITLQYSLAILSPEEMITQAINLVEKIYPTKYKQVAGNNKPSELYAFCNTKLRQLITSKNYVDSDDSDDEENEEEQH